MANETPLINASHCKQAYLNELDRHKNPERIRMGRRPITRISKDLLIRLNSKVRLMIADEVSGIRVRKAITLGVDTHV